MRISTANLAALASISAPTTAAGYSTVALRDNTMARPWLSGGTATSFAFVMTLPSAMLVDFLGIFDARGFGATITKVEAFYMASGVPVSVGELAMGARGDGSLSLLAPIAAQQWRLVVSLSGAGVLRVGELWLGRRTDLQRQWSEGTVTRQHATIANGDWRRRNEPHRVRLALSWDLLLDAEHDEMLAIDDAADGALRHVVVVPDESRPEEVYLGSLQDETSWQPNLPTWGGHAIEFQEARRCL